MGDACHMRTIGWLSSMLAQIKNVIRVRGGQEAHAEVLFQPMCVIIVTKRGTGLPTAPRSQCRRVGKYVRGAASTVVSKAIKDMSVLRNAKITIVEDQIHVDGPHHHEANYQNLLSAPGHRKDTKREHLILTKDARDIPINETRL